MCVKIRHVPAFVFLASFFILICNTSANADDLRSAVVKIITTTNRMDFYRPWQSKGIQPNIGSGCIISGNRILTNAHVVSDQTFIQIKKFDDPRRYTARVLAVGHDADLAILGVEDESFFDGVTPLEFGPLPRLQETVNVVGFPTGGDQISITEGVISRIEVTTYSHSYRKFLTVQIDAAINPGNSGGPVIRNGRLVGVAMQVANNTQNIGYIIPTPVISHFLRDLQDGQYDGFPTIGIEFNSTENSALRRFYKIDSRNGGVLVTRVLPFSPGFNILKEGDVVLRINGTDISEDGTFLFRENERLFLSHLISEKQINDVIDLEVVRGGGVRNLKVPLKPFTPLIPYPFHSVKPSYYIYGGVIFTVLTTDFLKEWGARWWEGPVNLNFYRMGKGRMNFENRKEIVVLLGVLPDDVNDGYHDYANFVVSKINGRDVDSFKGFILELIRGKDKKRFTTIETEQKVQIILDNNNVGAVNQQILKRNNIPAVSSEDVQQWLSLKN